MITQLQQDPRRRKGKLITELLKSKPRVNNKMRQALNAFNSVSRKRRYTGQMASPLPLTDADVVEHINVHGCNSYEPDILINIILALDNKYLELESERRKREAKNGS